jgi:hypothetical protein
LKKKGKGVNVIPNQHQFLSSAALLVPDPAPIAARRRSENAVAKTTGPPMAEAVLIFKNYS